MRSKYNPALEGIFVFVFSLKNDWIYQAYHDLNIRLENKQIKIFKLNLVKQQHFK